VEGPHHQVPLDRLVEITVPPSKTSLLQGTLDLIVLQLLRAEPTNGYDLTLRIQAISKDVLSVNAGSLYPALYRLEAQGLIKASWESTAKGRRAKVYSLTAAGRKRLVDERDTWQRFSGALAAILETS
jgi:PadR family transcriptional regulator, regulatory protein PadR